MSRLGRRKPSLNEVQMLTLWFMNTHSSWHTFHKTLHDIFFREHETHKEEDKGIKQTNDSHKPKANSWLASMQKKSSAAWEAFRHLDM